MTAVNAGIRLTLTAGMLWALLSLAWMQTHDAARATGNQIGPIGFGLTAVLPALAETADPTEAHAADLPTTTEPAPTSEPTSTPPAPPGPPPPSPQAPPVVATPYGTPPSNSATGTACSRCQPGGATP